MTARNETKTGDCAPVVIANGESTVTMNMRWGFQSSSGVKGPRFLVRDDSPGIDSYSRCLIPATALPLTDREGDKWLVSLEESGRIFCFAGVWREATADWPASYAGVTVPAYPDLKFIKRRHLAILPHDLWGEWLAGAAADNLLKPLPRRSLKMVPA